MWRAISTLATTCWCDWLIWWLSLVMWSQLPYPTWWETVCHFHWHLEHMCRNVSVFPEEMDVFQDTKLFSHQTAYPGGTQHFLSGTKLKSPPGKTDHPVQYDATASKGKRIRKNEVSWKNISTRQCNNTICFVKWKAIKRCRNIFAHQSSDLMLYVFGTGLISIFVVLRSVTHLCISNLNSIATILGPKVLFKEHRQVSRMSAHCSRSITCFCC